jgi:exonuclease VII small subunit
MIELISKVKNVKDLPTCISDIEAAIPGLEKVIADFKAGNYEQALNDGIALLPDVEKAYTDCLSSKPFEKKVGDMQQCITDIEGLIPGIEKAIADLKAGNENAAIL